MLISTSGLARSCLRLAFVGVMLAAAACGTGAVEPPSAPRLGSSYATARDGPLVRQLTGEVSNAGAWTHLQALQKIADENGGNRAAGTSGYEASVEYVVGVLRGAGFEVSTPTYQVSGDDGEGAPGTESRWAPITTVRPGSPVRVCATTLRPVADAPSSSSAV